MSRERYRHISCIRSIKMVMLNQPGAHTFPHLSLSHTFPHLSLSHTFPHLRSACSLLALDHRVTDSVSVLRRQLLKVKVQIHPPHYPLPYNVKPDVSLSLSFLFLWQLLHVREFAAQADYKDLCLPFTLNDLICSYCNNCKDLDLCRDDELLALNKKGGTDKWACDVCSQPYHLPAIESRLVAALQVSTSRLSSVLNRSLTHKPSPSLSQRRVRDYQLQDLECVRCKQVSSGHLRATCSLCSGDLRPSLPPSEFRKKLVVFQNMAEFHGFELLEQSAAWLLEANLGNNQPGGV